MGEEIRSYEEHLLRMAKSTHLFAGDLSVSLGEIAAAGASALDVERVSIWFFDDDKTQIVCADLYEKSNHKHSTGGVIKAKHYPIYFAAIGEGRVIAAHDAVNDPRTSEFAGAYLKPLNISAMLDAPIHLRGELVGIICHEHIGAHRLWSTSEMVFGASMADYVALSMEANDRAHAEQALRREIESRASKERLAALGEMSAVVAHEVRNPIGAIYNTIACLRRIIADVDGASELLDILDEEAQRIADLSSNLLDVARPVDVRIEPVKVDAVLRSAIAAAQSGSRSSQNDLSFEVQIPEMPSSRCDPRLLRRIVVNLMDNAVESATQGTSIRFNARYDERGNVLSLLLSNQAKKIDKDTLERMFDPFFTTKSVGSGLGLAIVQRLVEVLGGQIEIVQENMRVNASVRIPLNGSAAEPTQAKQT
jgi:signal transduction histidine kinase